MTASPVYTTPLLVRTTTTIRVLATSPELEPSQVAVGTYTINVPPASTAPVAFSPSSGQLAGPTNIALTTTSSPSVVCFTLDGSAPTCSVTGPDEDTCFDAGTVILSCTGSTLTYDSGSPIQIAPPADGGIVKIRAIACSEYSHASDITSATYTVVP